MKKRVSTFLMIAIVAVVMLAAVVFINRQTIFQEGNPLPVAGGIWQLVMGGESYAKIKDEPVTWVTRSGESKHDELVAHIEDAYDVKLKSNEESTYVFEGERGTITVSLRQYSRSFQIWELRP
jgi:hypothetical protein